MGHTKPPRPRTGGVTILWNDGADCPVRPSSPKSFYKSLDCWAWLTDKEKAELKVYIEPMRLKEDQPKTNRKAPPPPRLRKIR